MRNKFMRIVRWLWVNVWHGYDEPPAAPASTTTITLTGGVMSAQPDESTAVGRMPVIADSLL